MPRAKNGLWQPKQPEKKREPVVLLATSINEYHEIQRQHPGMKVRLDLAHLSQEQLFDTREFKDV